ncbi:MAG: right-handed parallel beta-helix repeat-containing protein [Planctomycetota bacterium]|nr:right-handed parallel beta-helix repeat-containing protein [Planctomycetota bacterium]
MADRSKLVGPRALSYLNATTWLLLAIGALTAACLPVHATEYFFDSQSGLDTNTGTDIKAPMQTLRRLSTLELRPRDTVRLKRGSTFRGRLAFRNNGVKGNPIRLASYGVGPKPEILGSVRLKDWQKHEGTVYKHSLPAKRFIDQKMVYSVYEYDSAEVPVRLLRSAKIPTRAGRFFFDKSTFTLYLTTSDGAEPSQRRIEVPVIEQLVDLTDRSWIEIDGLSFLFGNCRHIAISNSHDVTIRNCASLFVGFYGNPNILILRGSQRVTVADCFLYENTNCGVYISSGSTRCVVSGCTIVKCQSNDGVTIHSGGRDKNGVRQGLAGDHNVIENNVIGLCPEESIDITSGDHHVIRGNVCYGNGNPGIIVGHDSDHILIENNISFGNARSGIHIAGNEKEGARGNNRVARNLVYDNGYPGLEIQARKTEVFNNTVVNSRERVAIRINSKALGSVLRNNLVVTLDPGIRHPSLQFLGGTPSSFDVKLSHNFFYHVAKPDGRVLQTNEGNFTPAAFLAKYGTGKASQFVAPKFEEESVRHYFLTGGSPGIDGGTDVGLPFAGKAPDAGWKELGSEADAPRYPNVIIDGKEDDAAILYLWGKSKAPPKKPKQQTSRSRVEDSLSRGMLCESKGDFTEATIWYHMAAHSDATGTRRQKASDLMFRPGKCGRRCLRYRRRPSVPGR